MTFVLMAFQQSSTPPLLILYPYGATKKSQTLNLN
jgi:hypothetical protein